VTRRVRTGEAPGPLTHGTQPAVGEGGRRESQGAWADPEKSGVG
jgi:hypothetical protein